MGMIMTEEVLIKYDGSINVKTNNYYVLLLKMLAHKHDETASFIVNELIERAARTEFPDFIRERTGEKNG